MKFLSIFLITGALATQLQALDSSAVNAVAAKFVSESPEAQYAARMELYRLVATASAPGKEKHSAVSQALIASLQDEATPHEAKKYILRALRAVATPDAVEALAELLNGNDPLLKDEARQVLEEIPDPKAVAALESALRKSADKREKIGLATSLGVRKADSSVVLLAPLVVDADADIARAALFALARIGGAQATATLEKAAASSKVAAAVKPDVEEALLIATAGDDDIARGLFQSTQSDAVRLAAFLALMKGGADDAKFAIISQALKSKHSEIRQAALANGIKLGLPSLQSGLVQAMKEMPLEDRLVVLANIHLLKPAAAAGEIALAGAASADESERVAALGALGKIGTEAAFRAVLQAVGEKSPRISQTASAALAGMNYPEAGPVLLAMLKAGSSEEKILAIKAVQFRQVPGANQALVDILTGDDAAASREAMKSLYFTATLDDLKILVTKAAATTDPARKTALESINSRIAKRLGTDEAASLVK